MIPLDERRQKGRGEDLAQGSPATPGFKHNPNTCKENPNSECLFCLLRVPVSEPSFAQAFGHLPCEPSSKSYIVHWGRAVQRHSRFAQEQLDIFLLLGRTGTKR